MILRPLEIQLRSHGGSHVPDTITITDDRTGKTVTVPIEGGVFSVVGAA